MSEELIKVESSDLNIAVLAMNVVQGAIEAANLSQDDAPLKTPLTLKAMAALEAMFDDLAYRRSPQKS